MRRLLAVLSLLAVGPFAFPATARAAEVRTADDVVIGANEVIDDDLYVFGNTIRILGTVRGDVVAGGNTIVIDGKIEGSVNAGGNTITIGGAVAGSVRAAGQNVVVSGSVGRDLVAAGQLVRLERSGTVGKDVMAAANTLALDGAVSRDARLAGNAVSIAGRVGRDATVEATSLRIEGGGRVVGTVSHRLTTPIAVAAEASAGKVVELPPTPQRDRPAATPPNPAENISDWVQDMARRFVGIMVVGLLWAWLLPAAARRVEETLRGQPVPSAAFGCATLAAAPILLGTVFLVGLVIGGWGASVAVGSVLVAASVLAGAIVARVIGRLTLDRSNVRGGPYVALTVGAILLAIAASLPIVGAVVSLAVIAAGVGALAVTVYRARQASLQPLALAPAE